MQHEDLNQKTPGIRVQYAAAAAAIAPMAVLTTWMYGIRDSAPSIQEFFLGPMLFGGAMIFWLLYLHIVVCRDDLQSIGFRLTGLSRDVVIGALSPASDSPLSPPWPLAPSASLLLRVVCLGSQAVARRFSARRTVPLRRPPVRDGSPAC